MPENVVPKVRVELTQGHPYRFLRPARLPFRHFGTQVILRLYHGLHQRRENSLT